MKNWVIGTISHSSFAISAIEKPFKSDNNTDKTRENIENQLVNKTEKDIQKEEFSKLSEILINATVLKFEELLPASYVAKIYEDNAWKK